MRNIANVIVVVALILGVVYATQRFYERYSSPPARSPQSRDSSQGKPKADLPLAKSVSMSPEASRATHQGIPITCAIVVPASYRQTGTGISGLNPPAGDLGLLTPVGEMIAKELPVAARRFFQEVEVVEESRRALRYDLILHPGNWRFDKDTGYHLTGLRLIYASGSAFVSGHLEVSVELRDTVRLRGTNAFNVTESVSKITIKCGGAVPIAQLRKIMTDATQHAIIAV